MGNKFIQTSVLGYIFIYKRVNEILIHNFLYVFDNWGVGSLSHKRYSKITVRKCSLEGPGRSG